MATSSRNPLSSRYSPLARRRHRRVWPWLLLVLVVAVVLAAAFGRVEYAYMPSEAKVINAARLPMPAYDVLGRSVSHEEAAQLMQSDEGRAMLLPANGAIRLDDEFLAFGRRAFYKETFDNEYFLSDVIGALDGPITPWSMISAIGRLLGRGTGNLQVRLAYDVTIGGRIYRRGDTIDTGIDVPRGAFAPIGFKTVYDRGRIRVGVTCAACHVKVDRASGRVIEGPANPDINMGLILALAPNSAAYFTRTNVDVARRADLFSEASQLAPTRDGGTARLPDIQRLEDAVERIVKNWPPGNFDTMVDLHANPTRTPDSFTRGDHPYGWTGFGQIGPFQGLSTLGNNVHAFNADPTIESHIAPHFFGMAEETYLAILLQNASNSRFRFDPTRGEDAKTFLDRINPNPQGPGLSQTATLPNFPNATALVPHSVAVTRQGDTFWRHINAISAFQHSLRPPAPARGEIDPALFGRGRQVFEQAGCNACHFGPAFTSNRVLAASQVGTEPDRAMALEKTREILDPGPPMTWAWDTPVPVPEGARMLEVPTDLRTAEEMQRIMGHDGEGGYKVKGLIGLRFTAPYLHMGDVAVGPDANLDLGMPGTLLRGVPADPVNSLFAMIDRDLRARVIRANQSHDMMRLFNVRGEGHAQWVDSRSGYSPPDQRALVHYLLYLDQDANPPGPAQGVAGQAR